MRALLALALIGATAHASPIGIAWTEKVTCEARDFLPGITVGDTSVAWITKGKLFRRGLAKGEPLAGWKLKHAERVFVTHLADDLIVIRDPFGFTAYDAAGKTLFHRIVKANKAHWNQIAVGAGKILFEVSGSLEADDLAGKKLWTAAFGKKEFTAGLAIGTTLAFLATSDGKTHTIHAISLADGKEVWAWTSAPDTISMSMQVAGDTLAVAAHDGLQLLDATGKSAWTTAAPGQRVIGGDAGRIYTTGPVGGLFAYDRASGKLRWKDEIASASGESISLAVTASSLYTQDRDRLVELDPKTGAERASLGVGRMKLSMSEKSPSVLACAGGKQLAAYSPAAPDLVPEKATITGKVTAEFLTPDVSVSIAGVTAKLDGDAFKLSLTGRGRYVVWVITSGVWHEAKTSTVELAGKGKYDVGTVDVEPEAEGD